MFDYILTGPTSGVSAGQYIMGLLFQTIKLANRDLYDNVLHLGHEPTNVFWSSWGSVAIACAVTLYFFRQNLRGIHESSGKAMKIMVITTIMAVIMIGWCLTTLAVEGPRNNIFRAPDLDKKYEMAEQDGLDPDTKEPRKEWTKDPATGELVRATDEQGNPIPRKSEALSKLGITAQEDPIGFFSFLPEGFVRELRRPGSWISLIGLLGLFISFGHSILAMSGEETLAQVYREVESPKMKNFKKAAFIVFVYSIVLTAGVSFLAVVLIPDEVRMKLYSQNLIGGLARWVLGPSWLKLLLEAFVVIVGFLILSGAVNTAIIGSNGVLNRISEDGVLPDWFLRPHPRFGTTYRLLYLILILQLGVILVSGGDMILLGEAYAFGVVWSFAFKALAMVVLRFKDKTPREYKVPLNFRIRGVEVPVGLGLIFLVLLFTALVNLFTKEVATVAGMGFTAVFLVVFMISEHYHEKRRKEKGAHHGHMEQFNRATAAEVTPASVGLGKAYRKLVSIRSTLNLFMLEKALAETDPETTGVVVMTAKVAPTGEALGDQPDLDTYDQRLMTAVVERAEHAGKQVTPLIVPTNNPLHAVLNTAKDLQAHELVMGASNKYTADEQLEQIAFYWISLHGGTPAPLTVRILSRERDMYLDLGGGNRIPKLSERKARSVAELRAAGVGVDKVLLLHDGSQAHSDLFQAVLTVLDPGVFLALLPLGPSGAAEGADGYGGLRPEEERAKRLGRDLKVLRLPATDGPAVVKLLREGQYDLVIIPLHSEAPSGTTVHLDERTSHVLLHAHCRVFLAAAPLIPQEVVDVTPSAR
jgi:amino acid transporter